MTPETPDVAERALVFANVPFWAAAITDDDSAGSAELFTDRPCVTFPSVDP